MKNIKIYKKNNPDIFGCKIGLMENKIDKKDDNNNNNNNRIY